jgi:hypothetical protein
MATWKVFRGSDSLFEGTVTFATVAGASPSPFDLTGASLTWHMGSIFEQPMYTRSTSGTNFNTTGTNGVYTFSLSPEDTQNLPAGTTYWWDLWLKTTGNREYCLILGTLYLKETIGTV